MTNKENRAASSATTRNGAIDGLRTISVLLVFIQHTLYDAIPGGFVGVDIFFVISGFLITSILLNETRTSGSIALGNFYCRRAFRILPAALICFTLTAACMPSTLSHHGENPLLDLAAACLSFMNWMRAFTSYNGGSLGHAWSLSVEEQFYLLWPAALLLLVRAGRLAGIAKITFAAICCVVAWRCVLGYQGASPDRIYNGLDTRVDAILVGALIACTNVTSFIAVLARAWILPLLALAGCAYFFGPNDRFIWLYLPVTAITAGLLLLVCLSDNPVSGVLSSKIMTYWGVRSYSFYLWHMPVIAAVRFIGYPRAVWIYPAFLISLLAADLSYRLIEKPFKRRQPRPSLVEA